MPYLWVENIDSDFFLCAVGQIQLLVCRKSVIALQFTAVYYFQQKKKKKKKKKEFLNCVAAFVTSQLAIVYDYHLIIWF